MGPVQLQGKRVLVTGASRGIGEALARRFAAAGADVALVARSEAAIKALAGELGGTAHPADLAEPEQVAGLVGRIEADGGPIDVLVNNAAIGDPSFVADLPEGDVAQSLQVNLLTPISLSRQVIPGMLARGRGHIVNVSSMAGVAPLPGLSIYGTTKAALTHFTAQLRADLRGTALKTTVVELGPIPTDMLDQVESYRPTGDSFRRSYRLRTIVDVPREKVADDVVAAVEHERRHVRLPKRAVLFPLLAEAPRRIVEVLLIGVKPRA
jgi:short-subunit dehydrogenase